MTRHQKALVLERYKEMLDRQTVAVFRADYKRAQALKLRTTIEQLGGAMCYVHTKLLARLHKDYEQPAYLIALDKPLTVVELMRLLHDSSYREYYRSGQIAETTHVVAATDTTNRPSEHFHYLKTLVAATLKKGFVSFPAFIVHRIRQVISPELAGTLQAYDIKSKSRCARVLYYRCGEEIRDTAWFDQYYRVTPTSYDYQLVQQITQLSAVTDKTSCQQLVAPLTETAIMDIVLRRGLNIAEPMTRFQWVLALKLAQLKGTTRECPIPELADWIGTTSTRVEPTATVVEDSLDDLF